MINLEKKGKVPARFKKTCLYTTLPLHFLFFQIPTPREVIKVHFLPEKWGFQK